MSKIRPFRTYEQWVEYYYTQYQNLQQYQKKLNATPPTITLGDLHNKAKARALSKMQEEQLKADRGTVDVAADLEEDAEYREKRLAEYEATYGEFDDAGDSALLLNLVELETQFQAIKRDLGRTLSITDKEKYWKALRENSEAQKSLQVTLGIDKKSREQARISGNPMDNWAAVKEEIADWVDMLMAEFVEKANEATTEEDLRDLMKSKLSWPFDLVDSVVYNVKRVNGLVGQEGTAID